MPPRRDPPDRFRHVRESRVLTKRADENKSGASAGRLQVDEDIVIPGEGAGFLVHVSKPVEPAELVATVASVTGHAGGPVRQG